MTTTITSTITSIVLTTDFSAAFGFVSVVCLLLFVIRKETLLAENTEQSRMLSQALNVVIVPLLLAFLMIVGAKFFDLFG